MSQTDRQQVILTFITSQLLDAPHSSLTADDELLGSGLIDSLGVMRLIQFLEDQFELRVPPADVTIEHFSTVATIVAYIATLAPQHERNASA